MVERGRRVLRGAPVAASLLLGASLSCGRADMRLGVSAVGEAP